MKHIILFFTLIAIAGAQTNATTAQLAVEASARIAADNALAANAVPTSRTINGVDLSANRTLAQLGAASRREYKTVSFASVAYGRYHLSGTGIIVSNPSAGVLGDIFDVVIATGTATINGVSYAASRFPIEVICTVAGTPGTWVTPPSQISDSLAVGAGTWNGTAITGEQTFTNGSTISSTVFGKSTGAIYNQIVGPSTATNGNTLLLVKSSGSMGSGGSIFRAETTAGIGLRVTETGSLTYNGGVVSLPGISLSGYTIAEGYGIYLGGDSTHPIRTNGGSFLVGYTPSGANFGTNNLMVAGGVSIGNNTVAPAGNLSVTGAVTFADNLIYSTVGKGMQIKGGSVLARAGNITIGTGGTVTVANTTVTANTVIILTRKSSGGTIGMAVTYTLNPGSSFTINSDSTLDTSTYSFLLIEVNP